MNTVTLRAHYDGDRILLDEPFDLEPHMELVVTVRYESVDQEREEWTRFALQNLERAYGPDEPEYTLASIKEMNPDYEGR